MHPLPDYGNSHLKQMNSHLIVFDGLVSTFLTQDNKGRIWFTDTPRNQIGFIDIESKEITTKNSSKTRSS